MVTADMLRKIRLFRGLNQDEIEVLADITGEWECPKGQYIFKEGDDAEVLYILHSGEMSVVISTGILVNHKICILGENEVFGELGFIDRKPRTASIRCTQNSILLTITRDDFRRLGKSHPNMQRIIYKNIALEVATKLRGANEILKTLAGRDKSLVNYLKTQFLV